MTAIRMRTAAVTAVLASTIVIALSGAGSSGSGSVSLPAAGVTEDLNTLSATTTPSTVLPTGWYLSESGTGGAADGQYVVGTGSSNAGGAYSFGSSGLDRARARKCGKRDRHADPVRRSVHQQHGSGDYLARGLVCRRDVAPRHGQRYGGRGAHVLRTAPTRRASPPEPLPRSLR